LTPRDGCAKRPRKRRQKTSEIFHYAGGSGSPAWTAKGSEWTRCISGIGGELAAVQESGKESVLQLSDLHGDVLATASLSSMAKEPTAKFEFDEFGNPNQAPPGASAGSANAYDYADQDPVNGFDLNGECHSARNRHCSGPPSPLEQSERRAASRLAGRTPNRASIIIRCRGCRGASSSDIRDTFHSFVDKVAGAVDGAKTEFVGAGKYVFCKDHSPVGCIHGCGRCLQGGWQLEPKPTHLVLEVWKVARWRIRDVGGL